MSFFTDKKTLLVGAISLMSSVSAVMLTTQSSAQSTPFFTQSGSTPQIVVSQSHTQEEQSYILQGLSRNALVTAVEKVGGAVAREFPIINAISAYLTSHQATELASINGLRMTADRNVMTMSTLDNAVAQTGLAKKFAIDNDIATQTEADELHEMGITGRGVTVAVLDSGTLMGGVEGKPLLRNTYNRSRAFYKYDATLGQRTRKLNDDENGHGSHVTGIIASSLKSENGKYNGMAPDVYLLSVKAFDANGSGSYTDVLDGLNYIYQNRNRYRIRVVNLSLGAEVRSHYWDDPVNQAVMRLWDAGIVVVTSAGNSGSEHGTISVPGNNPYVISVGAMTDSYTPGNPFDDRMTTFSSKGPTYEGFVKPEVVAFGGHISSKMNKALLKNKNHVESLTGEDYHMISGTSQAAAVVSGTVALMLQYSPGLSPDDVKCRLMDSANRVSDPSTGKAYDPFTQGAGLINAYAAVMSTATGCANLGLDVQADLNGVTHFAGPARVNTAGELGILISNGDVITEGTDWFNAEGTDWFNAEGTDWFNAEGTDWFNAEGTDWFNAQGTDWFNAQGTDWLRVEGTDWFNAEGTDWFNAEGTDWFNAEGTDWFNAEGATISTESVEQALLDETVVNSTEESDELLDPVF
ncbi:S8 family peptidase [Aliiglaciecola sp. M165]|uniref:S8 family peptidase n=1 Tax=Aliiglaciecola sp. M165 TaxID=2593649 RepID=UPI00117D0FFC|nr:S8 family peptidase [Aliiglaciecola sp. M165]TRY28662.1 S8 family peptidase [Aliiglaciecola sp. M165]